MAYIGANPQISLQEYLTIDDISGDFDGVETSFALLVGGVAPVPGPKQSNQLLISLNGVIQEPDDTGSAGFRLSGGNIIFSSAPSAATPFFGVALAGADYVYAGTNFPDGSVTAPSITFANDLDSGFYRTGSGELAYTSNGTFRLKIDSSGRLGVGTSSPNKELTITAGGDKLQLFGLSAGSGAGIFASNNSYTDYEPLNFTGESISFNRRNGTFTSTLAMIIDSSGRLGLGTSTPSEPLTVQCATDQGLMLQSYETVTGAADTGPYIYGNLSDGQAARSAGSIAFLKENGTSGNYASYMAFRTRPNGGPLAEKMRIDSLGRVGIGTTSFSGNLTVNLSSTDKNISFSGVQGEVGNVPALVAHTNAGALKEMGFRGVDLRFACGSAERARIDSSGRLLVGTASAISGSSTNDLLQLAHDAGSILSIATSDTTISSGTRIGEIEFWGQPGSTWGQFASISCYGDTGAAAGDCPGRLIVRTTPDGTSTPQERIKIDSEGRVRHIPYGLTAPSAGESETPYFVGLSGVPGLGSDAGAQSSGFLRMMDLGPTSNEFIGIDIRNRNSGDMRICNEDSNVSNRANFVVGVDSDIGDIEQVLKISYLAAFYATGIYDHSTSAAANVNVVSGGQLRRSTSSAKYKTDIETLEDSYADALLNCRPVWYRSTCMGDNPNWSHWGLIAEEVAAIDPRLVHWGDENIEYIDRLDEDGNVLYEEDGVTPQKIRVKTKADELHPEGVAYDRFVPHLLNLIKRQKEQIEVIEARLSALESA
jgi:hypothetical protein